MRNALLNRCLAITMLLLLAACRSTAVFIAPPRSSWEAISLPIVIDGTPRTLTGGRVHHSFFKETPMDPLLGRVFLTTEFQEPARSVVLDEALWRESFKADPTVIGTSLSIDNASYTIVGVMPRVFDTPPDAQFWIPIKEPTTP